MHFARAKYEQCKMRVSSLVYSACAVDIVSALIVSECTYSVHCLCTHGSTVHVQCTLKMNSMGHCARTVYTVIAHTGPGGAGVKYLTCAICVSVLESSSQK